MEDNNYKCQSCSKEDIEKINITRVIDKLDSFYAKEDYEGAKNHLDYWEKNARSIFDSCSLLSILNEKVGLYRKINDEASALKVIKETLYLIKDKELMGQLSAATIYINIATTLRHYKNINDALSIYKEAEKVFLKEHKEETYEYATLLNNKASALDLLDQFDEMEKNYNKAIKILKKIEGKEGEIALSLLGLCHVYFDRDEDYDRVEETLDKAWEYINSDKINHDGAYAYLCTKCASEYRYFKRDLEANALEEVAKEIYGK